MSKQLTRTLNPEVKIIDAAKGIVDYIASNETLDCYQEVIAAAGWRFTRFAKNAPFVDSHNYWSIDKLLGKVVSAKVEGRNLIERVQWAKDVEENKLAQLGWKMTEGGFLKAVSVGFYPVRYVRNGGEGWGAALRDLGLTAEAGDKIRYIYLEQEQIELSACIIGANPDALAKAHTEGCVKDADLAGIGMDDDDMKFLHIAADALAKEETDELTRGLLRRELRRIAGKKDFEGPRKDGNSESPGTRAGGEEAERRAAGRREFLRKLGV
ncbi:hypothetical protein [Luteolibacter marinus]|uniref:hypothetical protein n=1 Tax=Luteolibacter marinus TaxID=2776705 RepID=UPI001866AC96|nr:hypothetical protein [Luteolibacter marinus]